MVGRFPATGLCGVLRSCVFHRGYSFLDLGTRHEELPLARLGHPQKITSPSQPSSTASLLHPPEPIAGVVRLEVQGSEKIKCMEYKGLN